MMAEPDTDPDEIEKFKGKLSETMMEINLIEAAIRTAEEQIAAVTREIEAARARAEAEARLEHEFRYIKIAEELERKIPEVARLAADAMEAIHAAYPKTGASWTVPGEGLPSAVLKAIGHAMFQELRSRGRNGLAALVQIGCGTFASPPPKPLGQAFVSDLALRTWEKRRQDGKGGEDDGTN